MGYVTMSLISALLLNVSCQFEIYINYNIAGEGIQSPSGHDIDGSYLDENEADIK